MVAWVEALSEADVFARLPSVTRCDRFDAGFRAFRPRKFVRLFDWCLKEIVNDQGRPYDHAAYPHLGAPGGPMYAWDDHTVREISLEWATRLGKSFFGQCALLYAQTNNPAPALVASESERSLVRVNKRTYKMIYNNKRIRAALRFWHERDHKNDFIEFRESPIYGGWARSAGTLADMNIMYAWANEFDKEGWDQQSTSKEGAPAKLFSDRLKDYWAIRKIIWESTPTIRGTSRVEAKRLQGNDCRYEVPCPHCKKYQQLLFSGHKVTELAAANEKDLYIQRQKDGRGAYICRHCSEACEERYRAWMMRRGVWCPKGCEVDSEKALEIVEDEIHNDKRYEWSGWDDAPWVIGEPEKPAEFSSYQLSSIYALSLGWTDMLNEFLSSQRRTELLRNFVNQWLGRTWELAGTQQTWQELYKRLVVDVAPLVVPEEHVFMTCGIDKQESHYVFVVDSWGPGRCSHTLDYGTCNTLSELTKEVLKRTYTSEDGRKMRIALSLIDRGYEPKTVDDFVINCKKKRLTRIMACRGSSQQLQSTWGIRTLGKESATPGLKYVMIDGTSTQDWLNVQLHMLTADMAGSTTLFMATEPEHQDWLEQMLNEANIKERDKRGKEKMVWVRINEDIPNDYRDCKRYAAVAMAVHTRGRIIRPLSKHTKKAPARSAQGASSAAEHVLINRPGGWVNDWRSK